MLAGPASKARSLQYLIRHKLDLIFHRRPLRHFGQERPTSGSGSCVPVISRRSHQAAWLVRCLSWKSGRH